MDLRRPPLIAGILTLAFAAHGCGRGDEPTRPQIAYVTNGIASFWTIAAAGAQAGALAFDVDCDVRMPANGSEDQKRILEDLLARGVDGIAISPVDARNQAGLIDEACALTHVITHDSDAPLSQRLCYVGMDNYTAGSMPARPATFLRSPLGAASSDCAGARVWEGAMMVRLVSAPLRRRGP